MSIPEKKVNGPIDLRLGLGRKTAGQPSVHRTEFNTADGESDSRRNIRHEIVAVDAVAGLKGGAVQENIPNDHSGIKGDKAVNTPAL